MVSRKEGAWLLLWALGGVGGCSFKPLTAPSDGRSMDSAGDTTGPADTSFMPLDAAGTSAANCGAIHTAHPALPSGSYTIDPDGPGGDAPLAVTCDMTAEGGGWTVIFFPTTINLTVAPSTYTASTPRLLADATSALIVYRTGAQLATGSDAVFDLPSSWKTSPPFTATATDLTLPVRIDGGLPIQAMLRFGQEGFGNHCSDAWIASTSKGRICLAGTTAPFFNGFVAPENDKCPNSLSYWYAANCTSDVLFSIAVR